MNNIQAIDFINRDVMDTDGILSKWSQEYPRLSSKFRSKLDNKPWGEEIPVYFDHWQDARF